KLFRTNDSEYYINNTLCRLRDIQDMLRDAGFAREGYTIIGQGRVTELINSKPEDRRAIFEEAAGISKYKFKKTEAERKNARTRANLERIKDAMDGDSQRLGPLTRQAEKARQYFDFKEKLKYHEINNYIFKYESASDTKDKLSAVIADYEAKIKAKQSEYETATNAYNAAMENLRRIEENLEAYRDELLHLSVDKEHVAGQIELYNQRLETLNRQNESLIAENATLTDNYNNLTLTAEQKQLELNQKNEKLKILTDEYEKVNAEYTVLEEKVNAEERKIEEARKSLLSAMERKVAVSKNMGELTAERANLEEHINNLTADISQLSDRIVDSAEDLSAHENQLNTLAFEKQKLTEEKESAAVEAEQKSARLSALDTELEDLKREYSVSVSRKNILTELQNSMEGYAVSVKKLLGDAKNNDVLRTAILGVVGQVIKVKEGFETAIETALGSAVSNVITRDEDGAKLLIAHLKDNRYGRATFLPLTSYKPRNLDKEYLPLLDRDGCFGLASKSIEYDSIFERIVEGLLGSTVIVDGMDTAIKLAKDSGYGFRIVTLDGDMVMPQGSYTGGSKKTDAPNVFSHERDLKEISAKVEEYKSRIDDLSSERAVLAQEATDAARRVKECTEDIHEYEVVEATRRTEYEQIKEELKSYNEEKAEDESMLKAFSERLKIVCDDIDIAQKSEAELVATTAPEQTDEAKREFDELKSRRDYLRDDVGARNIEMLSMTKDAEALTLEIARLKSEAIATAQRIESNDLSKLDNNRKIQEFDDELKSLTAEVAGGNDARRKELTDKLSDLQQYKSDLNDKVAENEKIRMSCSDEVSTLTEEKFNNSTALACVDIDMEHMQQHITEVYGLGYEECLQYKDENYDAESGDIEMTKIRRRIQNLGAINENAIEESQELLKVYHEKEIQRDDLEKSLADEERIIKEMSENMKRDFDDCFEKIRANFRDIFAELFNGGTADLELTENEDPLLCGVEIKAQPPSKNLQSISLLSGGEKTLTAIAILFAILRLRPMPFCLLDEIEAALDDANVTRFAAYLKKFSNDTQFIVITHRKPTMEQADCLYGVTMQEEGVSSIVSVRLADAVKDAVSIAAEED
ncbi:MAG: chromosome segregation protein SMC, partial [Clostridiales bacterium]|nr:chromosome segregation protein SMC [Clostridiales bacterium]